MTRATLTFGAGRARRGSVFILVLAILTVMALLTIMLAYSTKTELTASRNWAGSVQARMAAVTGVPQFQTASPTGAVSANATASAASTAASLAGDSTNGARARSSRATALSTRRSGSMLAGEADAASGRAEAARDNEPLEPVALNLQLSSHQPLAQLYWGVGANAGYIKTMTSRTGSPRASDATAADGSPASGGAEQDGTVWVPAANALAQLPVIEDESAKININAIWPIADPRATPTPVPSDPADPAAGQAVITSTAGSARAGASSRAGEEAIDSRGLPEKAPMWMLGEQTLARFIDKVLDARGISGVNAGELAHAIAMHRLGPDGRLAAADRLRAGADATADAEGFDPQGNALRRAAVSRAKAAREARASQLASAQRAANGATAYATPAPTPAAETAANDGIDNNANGLVDDATETFEWAARQLSDPRKSSPADDDRAFASLDELLGIEGMTLQAYEALAPYLTVFSASFDAWELPADAMADGADATASADETLNGWPQLDPNETSAERIYEALAQRFPNAPEALLAQFAANVIDRRDADDEPTAVTLGSQTYYGVELNPVINEVGADVATFEEDGDDGQFVELFNPYSRPMALTGWRLQGPGFVVELFGNIAAGGYLVLTDNYNNEAKANPVDMPGQGSFFNVFGTVATQGCRIEEFPSLDLPNESGTVKLMNAQGLVVDEFTYRGKPWQGINLSFQRADPRLRATEQLPATPTKLNQNTRPSSNAQQALRVQEQTYNQPYRAALDLMLVGTGWAANEQTTGTTSGEAFAMPTLTADERVNLDLRLIDCFQVGTVIPPREVAEQTLDEAAREAVKTTRRTNDNALERLREQSGRLELPEAPRCGVSFGRLNLNTAPAATLAALPGMTDELLTKVIASRARGKTADPARPGSNLFKGTWVGTRDTEWWQSVSPFVEPRWRTMSEFLNDETIWEDETLFQRLDAVYSFAPLVTFSSTALRVVTVNRSPEVGADAAAVEDNVAAAKSVSDATSNPGSGNSNDPRTREKAREEALAVAQATPTPASRKAQAAAESRPGSIAAEHVLTSDRGVVETVAFDFTPSVAVPRAGDPDVRSAITASKARDSQNLANIAADLALHGDLRKLALGDVTLSKEAKTTSARRPSAEASAKAASARAAAKSDDAKAAAKSSK